MVFAVVALLATTLQAPDTSTYANPQTARLIMQARVRHKIQDTLVHDYQAKVRTRVDAGFGRSRFARILPLVAVETAADITWSRPNDLRVKIVGVRSASAIRGAQVDGSFSDPWFVPRSLGDSIRFVDQELPETPALHPLADSAERFYRFAIFDSVSMELPGKRISAVGVRVEPKMMGPSLIAGNLWLDVETSEVVRMTFTYLGDFLWSRPDSNTAADSVKAMKENRGASRVLKIDAELEYALHESRYWMPYRQLVTLTAEIPWFINATVPVRFITTFGEYRINTGAVVQFTVVPDSGTRCRERGADSVCNRRDRERKRGAGFARAEKRPDGRWELEMPPRDSLATYEWPDKLALQPDPATEQLIRETSATIARMQNDLPAEWVGRNVTGLAFETASDLMRFNRVQGLSLGAGVRVASRGFSSLLMGGRFGFSDRRVTANATFRRDAPGGRLDVSAWRSVRETEPWTHGSSLGNTMNALFSGHDDADYYLATGGRFGFSGNTGILRDAELELRFERARSLATRARARLNDWLGGSGAFQPNPGILEGDFIAATATRRAILGPAELHYGFEAMRGVGGTGSGQSAGRGWVSLRLPFDLAGRGAAVTLRGGRKLGDDIPQLQLRVGGPETVRGYDYGTRSGIGMWSAQMDLALTRNSIVAPVIFADAGNTTISGRPLTSVGGGVSILGGLIRFNIAKGLSPTSDIRFDLLFRTAR